MNPSVNLFISVHIWIKLHQQVLDKYRLPLEKLSLDEQQEQSSDWVERILTLTDSDFSETFWTQITSCARIRRFDWDNRVNVQSLIKCFMPVDNVDYKRESYSLLVLMMELRSEYDRFPERRDYIKEVAKESTSIFLCQLNRRKTIEDFSRRMWYGITVMACVAIANWLFSIYHGR
ncbi:hypothetical protein AVEN_224690-1 [Araneus ventricosus]|uniref:Uncharacterized protein n=1 Tax=Araneus ventricosus TaxID=182803 RepID=A0A4Y2LPD5_ARAVE|nr:hypothetical protein AVEN_224690-1 [Araneus ventricosus]